MKTKVLIIHSLLLTSILSGAFASENLPVDTVTVFINKGGIGNIRARDGAATKIDAGRVGTACVATCSAVVVAAAPLADAFGPAVVPAHRNEHQGVDAILAGLRIDLAMRYSGDRAG